MACSGHGFCSGAPGYTCTCDKAWAFAPDCSERSCAVGRAWFAPPSVAADVAHDTFLECSNRGLCDRATGECACGPGFRGAACEHTLCPGHSRQQGLGKSTDGVVCSGHGKCLDARGLAARAGTSYGAALGDPLTWDAEKVFGCACDAGYEGPSCADRACPKGDDPNTASAVEAKECSGRGTCDRETGACKCFPGYVGSGHVERGEVGEESDCSVRFAKPRTGGVRGGGAAAGGDLEAAVSGGGRTATRRFAGAPVVY